MSYDGRVTEVTENFSARLQSAALNGTGYLEVHDTAHERRGWVFLEEQGVVAVLVDGYQPRLARRLTASELVSAADMGKVLSVTKDEYDPRIAVECVARGLVDAVTMEVLYREFMLSAASFVDEWELGDSQWVPGVAPWEGRSTAVTVPSLVNAMIRRKKHWASLWNELSTVTIPDRVPIRTGRPDYRPDSPDEAAVLRAIDGERTLDQVAGECGFTRFQAGHLMSGLMTKNVMDLFPVHLRRSTDRAMRVEAGYYPAAAPVPDMSAPDPEVFAPFAAGHTTALPPGQVDRRRPWAVPMTTDLSPPPDAHPASTHTDPQVAVIGPVAVEDPEGNVMTHQVEVEDTSGVVGSGHAPGGDWPVTPERTGGGADQPQPANQAEGQAAATDEFLDDVSWDPKTGSGVPGWGEPTETSQAATDLGEFFVNSGPPPVAVWEAPPATGAVPQYGLPVSGAVPQYGLPVSGAVPQSDLPVSGAVPQHDLPPLPVIAGRPSEFYATLPSTLHRGEGGLPTTAVAGPPMAALAEAPVEQPVAEPVAGPATEHEPAAANRTAPGTWDRQIPVFAARKEAAADQRVERDVKRDMEVNRLREELLRLGAKRKTAVEQAAVLHEQAAEHSTQADVAAGLVEETNKSIGRLTTVTSQASATAVSHFEGLQLARQEDVRIAALMAQIDEDAEKARKALVLGKHRFDESSAALANLERDLEAEMARGETVREEWTSATDSAARAAADTRHAEAAAAECDDLIAEARQRLTEMANADQ